MIAFADDDDSDYFLEITIKLGDGISIDAYLCPDGACRFSPSKISSFLGYDYKYFSQVFKRGGKKLQALQRLGFTDLQYDGKIRRLTGGITRVKALSFNDFCLIVEYEAFEVKNPKAIALLSASFRELIRGRTQQAFGLPEDDIETKQADFSASFYEREAYYAENREDLDNQIMLGDEGLDIAEYDTNAAQWENNLLLSKYFVDAA